MYAYLLVSSILQTDPTLIGGMVVDIGEYHIDMSIASKVKKLTNSLRGAI